MESFGWAAVIFPHALAFPLVVTPLGAGGATAAMIAVDAALVTFVVRKQPRMLSVGRSVVVLGLWVALSAITTLAGPYLIAALWRASAS